MKRMRKAWLFAAILAACGALADEPPQPVVIDDIFPSCSRMPCNEEEPATQFEYPSCADYDLNTSLIEAAEKRDRSAVELLQRRYAATRSWQERARLAEALLGRVANDAEIWKELEQHAENFVRFSKDDEETKAKLEAWCAEHGYTSEEYVGAAYYSFEAAASDRRSRPLLVRAMASSNRDLVMNTIYGFSKQADESALPLIAEALARFDSPAEMAELLCLFHSEAADQLAMKYITDEDERANYREMRQQP